MSENHLRNSRRRIWSEFVPYEVLRQDTTVRLLRDYKLEVLVAVLPAQHVEAAELARALADRGVQVGLWPMLENAEGRWGSTHNAQRFAAYVLEVAAAAPTGTTIAIDLEPPINITHGLLRGHPRAVRDLRRGRNWVQGRERLCELLASLRADGYPTIAAANPMILADGPEDMAWQRFFGTPVRGLGFDAVSFMTYTSLIEGYSRKTLPREIARSMLMYAARAAAREWQGKASLSLGTVGGGALGDETPYRSLTELEDDVAIALAYGVSDLALFDLSGVLAKNNPEEWIRAFTHTSPTTVPPRPRRRAKLVKAGIKAGGSALAWYRRQRRGPNSRPL